jgi:hypothetical protein
MDLDDIRPFDEPRERVVLGSNDQFDAEFPRGNQHVQGYRRIQDCDGVPVRGASDALLGDECEQRTLRATAGEAGDNMEYLQRSARLRLRVQGTLRRRRSM